MKPIKNPYDEGINTTATLIFSAAQSLLVAKAGATYVSPFVGRLDEIGHNGMELAEQTKVIYDNFDYPTEIIVAAARHPAHVLEAALIGAHITTMRFDIMEKLFLHPMTDKGLASFLADWEKAKK